MTETAGSGVDGTVLITVDSLRADALDPTVAPTMTNVAANATAFRRCFAHGNWTPFSFPSILGSQPVFEDSADVGLPASPTLAEVLADGGIRTAGFNAGNGFLTEHWGYDRGFDRFESFVAEPAAVPAKYLVTHPTVHGWLQLAASPLRRVAATVRGGDETPFVDVSHLRDVERRARSFLENVEEPFFCWIHYMDAHTPYVPAPEHLKAVGETGRNVLDRLRAHAATGLGLSIDETSLAALRNQYLGAVHQVDESVGRLLGTLEEAGLRESTLVVISGDHGEEFQDHGNLAHYPKLYDELVRVPLLVDHPDATGRTVFGTVGHRGVPPTICEAMGVDASVFDGCSLEPTVIDGIQPNRGPVTAVAVRGDRVTQQPIPRRLDDGELLASARTGRYTYIYHSESGDRELYERSSDPREQRNLFEEGQTPNGVVESLHAAVRERLGRLHDEPDTDSAPRREPPAALAGRLGALGYH